MTRQQYLELSRQLCHLVNVRRIQVGKEPLTAARIMQTVRRCLGAEPAILYPVSYPGRRPSNPNTPIDYALTADAKYYWATNKRWPIDEVDTARSP